MSEPELITLGEAMRRLNTSKHTIARIVKAEGLKIYANPLDRREKLVEAAAIEKLRRPKLVVVEDGKGAEPKKVAA